MKVLSTSEIAIKTLHLPGDWRKLAAAPEVEGRAARIDDDLPVVRASDKRLLTGKTEVAARQRLGQGEVLVKLVECTDAEAKAMELADASERRADVTAALVSELADQ